MSSVGVSQLARPWAFWSPSDDGAIAGALNLAGVGAGDRFLDLGCGDGRVLLAAARRGARVRGVEINAILADRARNALQAAGFEPAVEETDFFEADLEADVIFCYLTPAVLSHLRPRLAGLRTGTRIVAARYPIVGWAPTAAADGCRVYEIPPKVATTPAGETWPWRAVLVVLPPARRVLVPLTLASNGPVEISCAPQITRACDVALGAEPARSPGLVPLDLTFSAHAGGSVVVGEITANGDPLTVAAVFSSANRGQRHFAANEGPAFREALDETIRIARQAVPAAVTAS